jgi:CRP-like cAMP-binding protein
MQQHIEKLKNKVPIESLRDDCMARLGEHISTQVHGKGDLVFRVGDDDQEAVYLIEGEITLESEDGRRMEIDHSHDSARFALANLKPRLYTGRVSSDKALVASVSMEVLERCTAIDQISKQQGAHVDEDLHLDTALMRQPWVVQMLQTKEFILLPIENLIQVIERVEEVSVKAGEVVVKQGEPGRYFYIIAEGKAKITRATPGGEVKLDEIGPGEPFGESALISDQPRNASVTMLEDGLLKRLDRADFKELLETQYVCPGSIRGRRAS